jgi:hypothetical protein
MQTVSPKPPKVLDNQAYHKRSRHRHYQLAETREQGKRAGGLRFVVIVVFETRTLAPDLVARI